jgi:GNAT superfamily N-acetyltransferase
LDNDSFGVEVRRTAKGDAALLKQVRLAALKEAPSAFGSTYAAEATGTDAEWAQRAIAGSGGRDRAMFLAELDDEVIGLAGAYREEASSASVELVSMWVAPHARNRGVGAALIDAVTAWAIETDARSISLWVTIGNTPAETLYNSKGFATTGEVQPLPSDSSKSEARMELSLK